MKSESLLRVMFPFGCDIDCIFCLRNKHPAKVTFRMSAAQREWSLKRLGALMKVARARGVRRLELGGDEPTLAPHRLLLSVIRMGAAAGFASIRLSSNSYRLRDPGYVRRLALAGVNNFQLPVYGASAATHDAVTQKKGSYAALLRAVANIRSLPGVSLEMHTVPLAVNQGEIKRIVAGFRAQGIYCGVWPLNSNEKDKHVDYAAVSKGGRSLDSQNRKDSTRKIGGLYVRYNICTGQLS